MQVDIKKEMGDKHFVALHRGGFLKREQHQELIRWACASAKHVLTLLMGKKDPRLDHALLVSAAWEKGNATVTQARKAALDAIKVAQKSSDPVTIAVARAIGHAVATAHMADHSLRAAAYALKAVALAGKSVDMEKQWQDEQLPLEIRDLVLRTRKTSKITGNDKIVYTQRQRSGNSS